MFLILSFVFRGSIPLSTTNKKNKKIADYQLDTAIFFPFGATLVQQFLFLIYISFVIFYLPFEIPNSNISLNYIL